MFLLFSASACISLFKTTSESQHSSAAVYGICQFTFKNCLGLCKWLLLSLLLCIIADAQYLSRAHLLHGCQTPQKEHTFKKLCKIIDGSIT